MRLLWVRLPLGETICFHFPPPIRRQRVVEFRHSRREKPGAGYSYPLPYSPGAAVKANRAKSDKLKF